MSPSIRLSFLLLLAVSLLFAWLGVDQMIHASSVSISGLFIEAVAMVLLAWVVTKAPQLLTAMDPNSIHSKIARRFDPFVQTMLDRPLLYIGIVIGGCAIALVSSSSLQPWPILAIWVIGIVLFLLGAAPLKRNAIEQWIARLSPWIRVVRWELLAVVALTLLGFSLRGIALSSIPHNIHGDESGMGLTAQSVLQGQLRNPFSTAWLSHATLWFYIQALALRLFGNNITGLRMLSALLGTLTLPILYIFARLLYGRVVAIISTVLLAVYHFHVHYSRIGLNNIADPLMILLTLTAFFYGYRKHSLLSFAFAGIVMGIAQYFYFGARLIPVLVIALLIYLLFTDRPQLFAIRNQIGVMTAGFFIAVGPLLRYYIEHPDTFFARLVEHGLFQNNHLSQLTVNGQSLAAALANHVYQTFAFFIAVNEQGPFYGAGIPLLDHGMQVLFIIGLVLILLNWRKPEMFTLFLWLVGTAFYGGFLLFDPPQSPRYLIAAPALCILMGLALVQISSLLQQILALSPRWSTGVITLIVVGLMWWNIYFYFALYTPRNTFADAQSVTELSYYLRPQVRERYVYMFTAPAFYLDHATVQFVGNHPNGVDIKDPLAADAVLPNPPAGLRPVFIFIPDRLGELETVKRWYPNGQLKEYRVQPQGDRPILYIYEPQS